MRAAVLEKPQHPLIIKDVPEPALKPGYVLLRVRACGGCRTEVALFPPAAVIPL